MSRPGTELDANAIIEAINESTRQSTKFVESYNQRIDLLQKSMQEVTQSVNELCIVSRYAQKEMSEHKSDTASKFKEIEQSTNNNIQAVKADNNDAINSFKQETAATLARLEVKLDNNDKKNAEIDKQIGVIDKKIGEITPTTNRMKMIGDNVLMLIAKWVLIGAIVSAVSILYLKGK